jgi:hypothetical protein
MAQPLRDPAQEVPRLRRCCHTFFSKYAAVAWTQQYGGQRWDLALPPDIQALPEDERAKAHARHEAQRLADAHLYALSPEVSHATVFLGAMIQRNARELAVSTGGRPNHVAPLAGEPPSSTGFLHWQDLGGVAYDDKGAPVTACHWGPADGGHWVAWWSDGATLTDIHAAEALDAGIIRPEDKSTFIDLLSILGPLWYSDQQLLCRCPESARSPEPEPVVGRDRPDAHGPIGRVPITYITMAAWALLSDPPEWLTITHNPPLGDEAAADIDAGIRPRPVTVATTADRDRC